MLAGTYSFLAGLVIIDREMLCQVVMDETIILHTALNYLQ